MPCVPVDVSSSGEEAEVDDKDAVYPNAGQYFYTERERERLAADPAYLLGYRKWIEFAINTGFAIFYKDTDASRMAQEYIRSEMNRRLKDHPVLTEKLIPSWPVGCRFVSTQHAPDDCFCVCVCLISAHITAFFPWLAGA